MKVIKGRYNKAVVYTDDIDDSAAVQIKGICDAAYLSECKIRVMPDVHAGVGCTIGTTMTLHNCVVPNMVGVDIGCGIETVRLAEKEIDFSRLDALIRQKIPFGKNVRPQRNIHAYNGQINLNELFCAEKVNLERAICSIGTLGGGNHFIEIDRDAEGNLYLLVHSGSRHLGTEVASHYQAEGYKRLLEKFGDDIAVERNLAYVEGDLFDKYIADMKLTQLFASLNRKAMVDEIVNEMGLTVTDAFTTVHNYIDTDEMMLRKGAVAAHKKQKLLIPLNMRDGSLVCTGKGNEAWNFSAPHGAGRRLSRSEAHKVLELKDYQAEMKGIFSTCVCKSTIDEAPMAYKNKDELIKNVSPTVEINEIIKPVYNFKAKD